MEEAPKISYESLEDLWLFYRYLIRYWALSFLRKGETRLYDLDDLKQAGFLALCDAVRTYDPEKGYTFTNFLYYKSRDQFRIVAGIDKGNCRPHVYASSLDELSEYDGCEDVSRIDILADPSAEFEDNIVECEAIKRDYADIIIEIEKLPSDQQAALLLTARDGLTCAEVGEVLGESAVKVSNLKGIAIRNIRKTKRAIIMQNGYESHHVSLKEFLRTHISVVEKVVLGSEGRERFD